MVQQNPVIDNNNIEGINLVTFLRNSLMVANESMQCLNKNYHFSTLLYFDKSLLILIKNIK